MFSKIYLAGDISFEDRWRPKVMKACNRFMVEFMSPVDTIDYRYKYLKESNEGNRVFLHCDFKKIDLADVVFAYLRKSKSRHSGTSAEIGYARAKGKLIIYINDMPKTEAYLYEFVERCANETFATLPRGIAYLKDYLREMVYNPELIDVEEA